jgi:hypothetical protein
MKNRRLQYETTLGCVQNTLAYIRKQKGVSYQQVKQSIKQAAPSSTDKAHFPTAQILILHIN